jgi:AcrR family transcriptional regulator
VTRRSALQKAAHPRSDEDPRPLRRDAEVNLGRILVAARDVFAEQGYDAPMEAIANRAEVGVGTLYRRFPAKADLFNAVVESARQRNLEIAEQVLSDVAPAEAVFEFVRRCISVPSVWRATTAAPPWGPNRGAVLTEIAPLIAAIVNRSKGAGTLRTDVEVTDIVIVLKAVRSIADLCDTPTAKPSLRFLELALDGLRPGPASPTHPPLRIEQLAAILSQG